MLKIKLARFGKKKQPHYRVVINEARDKRDGSYVASIGHYAPTQTPKLLTIDVEAYKGWLAKGAQPTDTVAALYARFESGNPFPAKKPTLSKKAKAKQEAAAQEAEAAKLAKAQEAEAAKAAPAEEVVAEASAEPTAEPAETTAA